MAYVQTGVIKTQSPYAYINWFGGAFMKGIDKARRKAIQNSCKIVAAKAKKLCPEGAEEIFVAKGGAYRGTNWTGRIPGTLRKSIRYKVHKSGAKGQVIAGGRSGKYLTAFYAMWVEFGTSKQFARPYLRPALESSKDAIAMEFSDWI